MGRLNCSKVSNKERRQLEVALSKAGTPGEIKEESKNSFLSFDTAAARCSPPVAASGWSLWRDVPSSKVWNGM